MKKAISLFLVLLLVSLLAGCGTTTGKETATTSEAITLSHEDEVNEFVQWAIVNIINKNSVERYGKSELHDDVKEEIESYISSLPPSLSPRSFSIELAKPGQFKVEILF